MAISTELVSPLQVHQGDWVVVDVRSAAERAAECIPCSMHLPLEHVESGAFLLERTESPVALLCKGGVRAKLAQQRLASRGVTASVIEGGIDGWKRDGLPVIQVTRTAWSLERQVRLGAGLLVLAGTVAAVIWGRNWLWFTGAIGCGLTFAGATDICMMGRLLARMPWNRVRSAA